MKVSEPVAGVSHDWARNALDEEYFEILNARGSSSGYYAGLLGDPRTYGITLRTSF